jgi:hypothetical protein
MGVFATGKPVRCVLRQSALSAMMSVLSCEMTAALAEERVDNSATAASRLCACKKR